MWTLLRRLRARLRYRNFARDIAEEIDGHRRMTEDALRAGGEADADARVLAQQRLGRDLAAREASREVWMAPRLDQVAQDVRLAWRQLRSAPVFSTTAVALCALGIGGVTAVFSVLNALLIAPLPYPHADRIYALAAAGSGSVDGITFHAARARPGTFDAIAAQRSTAGWNLAVGSHAAYVGGLRVTESYFDVLGVPPLLGRGFSPVEDAAGGPAVAVISHRVWQDGFGGDPAVVGRQVLLGGTPHEVVGVMPADFRSIPPVDVWTPLRLSDRDNTLNYLALGRLAEGISPAAAGADLALVKSDMMRTTPHTMHRRLQTLAWLPIRQMMGQELVVPLALLTLTVIVVTGIASANLAGLLLFRTLSRGREVATRLALGGGAARIVQQLLTESLLIAALGGLVGVAATVAATSVLTQMVPAALLVGRRVTVDGSVLAVSALSTVGMALLFGLAPALAARRVDLRGALGDGRGSSGSPARTWSRRLLLCGEVAGSMALLVVGGLLVTMLLRMYRADLGFDPTHVIVGQMSLSGSRVSSPEALTAFADRAVEAMKRVPGVEAAALANNAPVERALNLALNPPEGSRIADTRAVDWRDVTPEYLSTLRIRLRQGRAFGERDGPAAPRVALVNEAFARAYFGAEPALHRVIQLHESAGDLPREIVGIVQDIRGRPGSGWTRGFTALGADAPPMVYVPLAQAPAQAMAIAHQSFPASWVVRVRAGSGDLSRRLEETIRGLDPSLAFVRVTPMTELMREDVQGPALLARIIGVLSVLALAIASTGVFGLVAYSAQLRRRETAIRVALGASRSSLVRAFLHETAVITAVGLGVGVGLTMAVSSVLGAALGETGAPGLAPLALAALVLGLVLGTAGVVPALRASRADPVTGLRE